LVLSLRAPNVAPFVITLSVSERHGFSLIVKRRFSMSETASLSLTMQLWCKMNAEPSLLELC